MILIQTEVESFLQQVAVENGNPTSLTNSLVLSFSNVICSLLMSVRFSEDDPRFKRFTGLIEEGFQLCTATGASNFIPCLKNLPRLQALNLKIQAVSVSSLGRIEMTSSALVNNECMFFLLAESGRDDFFLSRHCGDAQTDF